MELFKAILIHDDGVLDPACGSAARCAESLRLSVSCLSNFSTRQGLALPLKEKRTVVGKAEPYRTSGGEAAFTTTLYPGPRSTRPATAGVRWPLSTSICPLTITKLIPTGY